MQADLSALVHPGVRSGGSKAEALWGQHSAAGGRLKSRTRTKFAKARYVALEYRPTLKRRRGMPHVHDRVATLYGKSASLPPLHYLSSWSLHCSATPNGACY